MTYIYLDNNATTKIDDSVLQSMIEAYSFPYNPSSIHSFGKKAKMQLESVRESVLNMLNIDSGYKVIFTSSGTEANNIALKGFPGFNLITSAIEHYSVLNVVGKGVVQVDKSGVINLDSLEEALLHSDGKTLISIMYANNETGVIQPIEDIVKLTKKYNMLFHTDAVQAIGKKEIVWHDNIPDLITISAHKFGGPQGVGALVYREDLDIVPIMMGGGQEFRRRPGTHNFSGIVGMGMACSLVPKRIQKHQKVKALRDKIQSKIKSICSDSIIFGESAERLPNTLSISMPGVKAETQVIYFDLAGIAVSAGSACSSGSVGLPHVHASMGYKMDEAISAIRVSLGVETTEEEVNRFISEWENLYNGIHNEK